MGKNATERDQRFKQLFRTNLIEHRLQRRPELFATNGSYQAMISDPKDIRVRHGHSLSHALDVFTFFAVFLLFNLFGEAFAATDTICSLPRDAEPGARVTEARGERDMSGGLLYSPINLYGNVWSAPTNNFPQTQVSVYDPDGNIFLGNTMTAPGTGNYNITVLPVGLENKIKPHSEMVVLGNPVMNEANLELSVLNQDNYKVSVFDVSGRQLYSQMVSLAEGNNKITINGLGAPGIKIVQVTDGQKAYTAKVIQTTNAGMNPSISATGFSGNTGQLKSSNYTVQLEVQFTPQVPGYIPNIKIVPAVSQTLNDTVQQTSQTINKTLHVYDVNGLAVAPGQSNVASYYSLKVKFKDNTEIVFPAVNGIVNINRTEYGTNFTDTLILIPDTILNPKFLEWMIGREIHQPRYKPNVFQNEKEHSASQYIPPGNVKFPVSGTPIDMQMYVIPEKMLDPRNMTDSITMDISSPTFELMCRGPPIYMTKFVDVTNARPLYFVIDTWDATTNNPVPIADQDRVQTEMEKQVNVIPFLANSDSLLGNFVITRESSYNSAIWQQIIARGSNQFHETTFKTESQPSNIVQLTLTGSYNGKQIMKNSYSSYPPSANNYVIGEELWEGIWCMKDPQTGGTAQFIYNVGTSNISDYCKAITRWKLLLDPGTYVN